ncbi:hypothetical protein, partial [Streptomyces sp. WAC06614]|uniref:hypothetical protein n=1 Tax=Streptomyces sp. WAC06614 TaxID=2487416 RepID=UPI000F9B6D4F
MTTEEEIVAAKNRIKERLFALPGVLLVGVGGKEVGGVLTTQPAVKVLVREKFPARALAAAELIPSEVDGIPTDVVGIGGIVPHASERPPGVLNPAMREDKEPRLRPLTSGAYLGPEGVNSQGTLGCFLKDRIQEWKVYALTCQHVITGDGAFTPLPLVSRVGQPRGVDGFLCSDIFGAYVAGAEEYAVNPDGRKSRVADRDEGLIRLRSGERWRPFVEGIGEITGVHPLTPLESSSKYPVRKYGGRTQKTGGVVSGMYDSPRQADNLILVTPHPRPDQQAWDTRHFSWHGDSGSVVVNDTGTNDPDGKPVVEVVGLLYGGTPANPGESAVMPIQKVLERFAHHELLVLEVATIRNSAPVNTVPD